ncbi:MAG: c-type cytochrome [Candidatus Dadabacteria bacterium]|nr:c-type cytochrome [Candidatus Dadabacteria bacterium]MYA48601.1 c-type cytochrome [Candidatus Dadabacteria bacterium]MYF48036.1 c-type cytochrome [Candidatus Dadabacteria bacterium]MYG82445.1 c-type cytochrome [Candidatus Dadabacteria bacterium]MYK50030.1 c-type cytochrome [Candidatus Dadabacteria bacterium]
MLRKSLFRVTVLIFFLFPGLSYAGEMDRILSLVDYIGGDYLNAVEDGKIINEFEYQEMLDFSSAAVELWEKAVEKREETADFSEKFARLHSIIVSRGPSSEVESLAGELKGRIISAYDIKPYPAKIPDYESGKALYAENCSSCHGLSGRPDDAFSKTLNPPPTDFTDPDINLGLSPFKVYNTTTFGIEGTAMTSFEKVLDEKQKWDVAFYVLSLGYPDIPSGGSGSRFSSKDIPDDMRKLENLALASNAEILLDAGTGGSDGDVLFYLRTTYLRDGIAGGASEAIAHTIRKLERAVELYEAGRKDEALEEALDGYLGGFQKIEPALVSKKRTLVLEVEKEMGFFRSWVMSDRDSSELRDLKASIEENLLESERILKGGSSLGKYLSFVNSFAIILREALEALLIIAAIIAALAHSGNRGMIRYVHYGWVVAIFAGFATWVAARTVIDISGARREIVEGVTSLLAAMVLFYVSYWLVSKADVKKWKEYVRSKTQGALTRRSGLTLAFVSFLAVYREAFETMLFYQALFYQTGSSMPHVVYGLVAGVAVVFVIAFLMYRFTLRIPLKYFFSFASIFLYLLCFILLGKGILEFQESGIISSTSADFIPYVDTLGIYPTYETAIPQAVLIVLALLLFARHYGYREKHS